MLVTLPNAFGDAATNMAIDAALLENIPRGLAAFRHYGWLEPAASFGYAQAYKSVASVYTGADPALPTALVRRLTGGGIVDHRNDWTYALIIEASLHAAQVPATELYACIHRAIGQTLASLGIEARLAPCPKNCPTHNSPLCAQPPSSQMPPSKCFESAAANDVLRSDGRKIAGAAMKRSRRGLLIQGSIDRGALPDTFNYMTFQSQLVEQLATALNLPAHTLKDIRPLFHSERIEAEKKRFADDTWNQRR